jgi:hypothetical protein
VSVDKLLEGNETVLAVPAVETGGVPFLAYGGGLVNIAAPTVAALNYWQAVTSNGSANSGAGGNISCALKDDLKLSLTDSSTDKDRTICSVGQSEALTFYNFVADLTIFRDAVLGDTTSVFNMARDLFRAPDLPYVLVHRIGKPSSAAFAVGDEVDLYYAWTDNPVPVYADGGNQQAKATLIPKNIVNISYTLTA